MAEVPDLTFRHPEEPRWVQFLEERLQAYVDFAVALAVETIIDEFRSPGNPAVSVAVTIQGGQPMPVVISIDDKTDKASFAWKDDHGDAAAAPAGVTVALASDNAAVATLAVDPADPTGATFDITPVGIGGVDAAGNPDGTANIVLTATTTDATTGAITAATYPDGPSIGMPVTAPPTPFGVKAGPASQLVVAVAP